MFTRYDESPFVDALRVKVRNFSRKSDWLWNFSCPVCGDSQKDTTKARGYVYSADVVLAYKCHNCGYCGRFATLLKQHFPDIYREYQVAKFKNRGENEAEPPPFKIEKSVWVRRFRPGLKSITKLPELHSVKIYCKRVRKIPDKGLSRLYHTENFSEWVMKQCPTDEIKEKYQTLPQDERIVIPCVDSHNRLIGCQGRSLSQNKSNRYLTVKLDETFPHLVFGLDRHEKGRWTILVEGPIDSLFLPNCIAALGSDLASTASLLEFDPEKTILVFDNEPRNKEILRLMNKAITNDHIVCIWPEEIKEKDINDMVLAGMSPKSVLDIISTNVHRGHKAMFAFKRWSKVI